MWNTTALEQMNKSGLIKNSTIGEVMDMVRYPCIHLMLYENTTHLITLLKAPKHCTTAFQKSPLLPGAIPTITRESKKWTYPRICVFRFTNKMNQYFSNIRNNPHMLVIRSIFYSVAKN
jgi:hypothetical protein